jgi:spore maturation protein CgeB
MKILLYGESHIIGSGAYFYAKAIEKSGYELLRYDDHTCLYKYKNNFFYKAIRKLNKRLVLSYDQKKHFSDFFTFASLHKPDIIIILKGLFLNNENIKHLKRVSKFVIVINHDDYFSLNNNNFNSIQLDALSAYDHVFVTRLVNLDEIKRYNKNVDLLLFSYDSDVHTIHKLESNDFEKYMTDVLFIGTYEKSRAKYLENLISNTNFTLSIYGQQWQKLDKNSILRKCIKSYNGIWMEEMAKAIQVASITLGFLRKENRDEYTQRTFEIPACGGLLLGENTNFQKSILIENTEAFYFDINISNDLEHKINFILNNPEIARNVRIAGNSKIKKGEYNYTDKIKQIIDIYTKRITIINNN